MLEHLVNEDQEAAKEIFHQIVVEKSRQIYENILSEDFDMEEAKDEEDEEDMEEAKDEEDEESVEEAKDEDDEEDMEEGFAFGEADDDIGGDPADDQLDDISADGEDDMDMGDEEGSDELEDRVVDLEDAIDDLRAEFEKMMGDEGDDMDMGGDDMDMDMGGDDMDMGDESPMKMGMADDVSFMREYIEKVGNPKHGDNGSNSKSIVAGKNDMGGTAANIVAGGESTSGGTKGGLANPSTKEDNAGNVNVPGGKAGVKHLKKMSSPKGGDDGDKGAQSPINGVKSRAK
jgi:hypothetical protein